MTKCSRLFFVLFTIWFAISCSQPMLVANGIGGTGKTEEGIGGTGQVAQEGMGGTGQIAHGIGGTGKTLEEGIGGTGIVGTITGFGSIWVNKAHVHFDQNTPVTINQESASYADFKIGQVVSLMSDKEGKGYQARAVDIVHEVVGPIQQIANNQLTILGQKIFVESNTPVFANGDTAITFKQLNVGDWVKVSGYRKPAGEVLATRLDKETGGQLVELIGPIKETKHGQSIFNQTIEIDTLLASASDVVKPNTSRRVLVVGRYVDGIIRVERVESDSIQAVIEEASELIWEGFIYEWDDDFFINGIEFEFEEELEFLEDELFILEGEFEDDEFILDEIYEADEFEDFIEDLEELEDFEDHEEFEDMEEFEEFEEFDEYEDFEEYDEFED